MPVSVFINLSQPFPVVLEEQFSIFCAEIPELLELLELLSVAHHSASRHVMRLELLEAETTLIRRQKALPSVVKLTLLVIEMTGRALSQSTGCAEVHPGLEGTRGTPFPSQPWKKTGLGTVGGLANRALAITEDDV
jgi:hypothetical protein